ncbi:MAG: ArsC family transcriptional regulator [Clostridia bacterium]
MNIQIFGKTKCFASRSAERFFKERKIKYQFINIIEKGLSPRELDNVIASVKDIDLLFDKKSSLYESLYIAYIKRSVEDKRELLLSNSALITTPIVRDCDSKKCALGDAEKEWKSWL